MSSTSTPPLLSRVYLDLYPRLYPPNPEKNPSLIFSALLILVFDRPFILSPRANAFVLTDISVIWA